MLGTRHRHPFGAHRSGAPSPRSRASCSSVAHAGHPPSSLLRGTPFRCTLSALTRFVFLCRPCWAPAIVTPSGHPVPVHPLRAHALRVPLSPMLGTRHRHPFGAHRPGAPSPRSRASCSSVAHAGHPPSSLLRGTPFRCTLSALTRFVFLRRPCWAPAIVTSSGHTVPVHPLRAHALRVPLSPMLGTRHRHPFGAHRSGAPSPRSRASCSSVAHAGHPPSSPLRGTPFRCTLCALTRFVFLCRPCWAPAIVTSSGHTVPVHPLLTRSVLVKA